MWLWLEVANGMPWFITGAMVGGTLGALIMAAIAVGSRRG